MTFHLFHLRHMEYSFKMMTYKIVNNGNWQKVLQRIGNNIWHLRLDAHPFGWTSTLNFTFAS